MAAMQILMVAEKLPQPSDGYRRPSATVKIRKQMRKPKQNTNVFLHIYKVTFNASAFYGHIDLESEDI